MEAQKGKENPMKRKPRGRIVMIPAPFQGHTPPSMNLARALHSNGFSIIIVQTHFNFVDLSNSFPDFEFLTIPDGLAGSEPSDLGLVKFVLKLNAVCEPLVKECLVQMVKKGAEDDDDDDDDDGVGCVIYDEFMYSCGDVARDLKLQSIIFSASCSTTSISRCVLTRLVADGLLPVQESESMEDLVGELHPLRFRDLPTTAYGSIDELMLLYRNVSDKRESSAKILNTTDYLEPLSSSRLREILQIEVFPVGPLHKYELASKDTFPASPEEDGSCIGWLDGQKPKSVVYISLGSLALMQKEEMEEMAWGLANCRLPFLWVIRPGCIPGSEWIESLPEDFYPILQSQGRIIKWAPQKQVLQHAAVGVFWSHCGWNSTLESISEGVPMICRPFSGDQRVNARLLSHVLRVGLQVEEGKKKLERGMVESALKRVMVDEEGEVMRVRVMSLKKKIETSVRKGGSSYDSLDKLAHFITSGGSKS